VAECRAKPTFGSVSLTVGPAPVVLDVTFLSTALWFIATLSLAGSSGGALGAPQPALATMNGVSIAVHDGDSFVLRTDDGQRVQIRISGIDAPEKSQPYADVSRRHLAQALRERRLRIEPVKRDPYDRLVAKVLVDQGDTGLADAGLAQIEAGMAWHFRRYAGDQPAGDRARYAQAERDARQAGSGLWQDPAPVAPWDFRAQARANRPRN